MNRHESFSNAICEEELHLAERELSCFIAAVTGLYGSEQARHSADDWLEELGPIDRVPGSEPRNWRSVTIAASARLAERVKLKAVA